MTFLLALMLLQAPKPKTFPWFLCAIQSCTIWHGNDSEEWNLPTEYKGPPFGGSWYVESPIVQKCVEQVLSEKVDSTIRYETK